MKKWKAKKAYCAEGHKHDSLSEAKRCDQLHEMLRRGDISDLIVWPQFFFVINGRQVKHDNGRRCGITLDFGYSMPDGREVCEDVKPKSKAAVSRDWPLRKAMFKALFPGIELRETQPSNSKRSPKENEKS
jgi:hypothetical protein